MSAPQDANKVQVTIVTHRDYQSHQRDVDLVNAVQADPLRSQVKHCKGGRVLHLFNDSPLWVARTGVLPEHMLPAIIFTRPDGGVFYEAYGAAVPFSSSEILKTAKYYWDIDRKVAAPVISQDCDGAQCRPKRRTPIFRNPDGDQETSQRSLRRRETGPVRRAFAWIKSIFGSAMWIVIGLVTLFALMVVFVFLLGGFGLITSIVGLMYLTLRPGKSRNE